MSKIICVVPSIRPASMESFRKAWAPLFEKHNVTLITVWDGEDPVVEWEDHRVTMENIVRKSTDLFCRFTDACRNLGFLVAAKLGADYILTLDDDVAPYIGTTDEDAYDFEGQKMGDPIQQHLDVLNKRVPLSWMNTAHDTNLYLRGFPYLIREEAPVMLSHGVWVGVPDFDGETQLKLESDKGLPHSLPYYVGPIPRGVLFSMCGMNVMIRKEALPYFYFAPMGPDTKVSIDRIYVCDKCEGVGCKECCNGSVNKPDTLNRFADIWCGIFLKREFDRLGWACYTGGSVVEHTRASDARKNMEQEKLGRDWNEWFHEFVTTDESRGFGTDAFWNYVTDYTYKRDRYADLIRSIQEAK